jgi:electron transport complex protein RnfC
MKFFKFSGGVHPEGFKTLTTSAAIEKLPLPRRLYVPLQQHIGAPAKAVVEAGQHVLKGELIAESQGNVSASVHAPTSGTVTAVAEHPAPHPSGLPVTCIIIDTDGKDEWIDLPAPVDPFRLPEKEIAARVSAAGIVGLGGATFPSALKFNLALKQKVDTLVINGAECEPYLTSDDRLMQERTAKVVDGIRIMMLAVNARRVLIAIEDNKPQAHKIMAAACEPYLDIQVMKVPTRYPMGSEKHLVYTVTGKEIPAGKLAADIGVMVHNVGTAYAVYEALFENKPLLSRIVTISGGAVTQPRNLEVLFGTPVSELIDYCGGLKKQAARLLMGGPLMGLVIPDLDVPVIKGCNGVIALTKKEVRLEQQNACIRCSRCVAACPCGLVPLEMAANIKAGNFDRAVEYGVRDCISCGSCAYVCPSNIPLVHFFNYAKGELVARHKAKEQQKYTGELTRQRQARMEKIEKERAAIAAKAAAAKKAREARLAAQQQESAGS